MPVPFKTRVWNWRRAGLWVCSFAVLAASLPGQAAPLVTPERAGHFGLERMWFAQVSVDAARGRISQWAIHHDQLFSLSSSGTLQALNAETGETLWTVRIGTPDGVFAGPAVNAKFVALTSGTNLYVLDRTNGHVLWSKSVDGAVADAPALSERYAFVGLMNGLIQGYSLEDPDDSLWYHQSVGRIFYSPTVAGEAVCWPTDRGYLYVAQSNQPRVLFRVEMGDEIVAPPAEWEPYLYVSSRDGCVRSIHELSGAETWRASTGYPIITKPAAVAGRVYIASEEPALHAVEGTTGRELWSVAGVSQFAAAGAKQVYGMDRFSGLVILEKDTGGAIGRLSTGEGTYALVNDQSDRIYLVSDTGLVQCLRERKSEEPTYYRVHEGKEPVPPQDKTKKTPFAEEAPAAEPVPPQAEEEPAEQPAEEPDAPAEPKEKSGEEDNPFTF